MNKVDWETLKVGDIIKMKRSLTPRKILKIRYGSVTLNKVRGFGTTVYCNGDKYLFETIKTYNNMSNSKLFQYAVLWHPTEKQIKEEGAKSKVLVEPKTILAPNQEKASMIAVMEIPADKKGELDQIEVVLRPF